MQERRILLNNNKVPEGTVDLELPSGTLWAKGNICKDSNGNYYMGEETDYGCYFSWGNIDGHNIDEHYNPSQSNYLSTPGASLTGDIASNDAAHDAALACLGSPWRMPSYAESLELVNNTDYEWVEDYNGTGVSGHKFMKKTDHSVYIFIGASGRLASYSPYFENAGKQHYHWTSTYGNDSDARSLQGWSTYATLRGMEKHHCLPIRAVRSTT